MNKVEMLGRLTKDVQMEYTQGDKPISIAKYSIAVQKKVKKDGEETADFFNCVCFGKVAEFAEKFLKKGQMICICGRLSSGKYVDKNDITRYTTDIIVEEHYFTGSKSENSGSDPATKNNGDEK